VYVSLAILYTEYTGWRHNDFSVRTPRHVFSLDSHFDKMQHTSQLHAYLQQQFAAGTNRGDTYTGFRGLT
jgi:hypothetical protein